jgi:putative transposase
MEEDSKGTDLGNVIRIDDERVRDHLGRIVRGTVEETLNAMLEAEADRLCNAERYERTQARRDQRFQVTGMICSRPVLGGLHHHYVRV